VQQVRVDGVKAALTAFILVPRNHLASEKSSSSSYSIFDRGRPGDSNPPQTCLVLVPFPYSCHSALFKNLHASARAATSRIVIAISQSPKLVLPLSSLIFSYPSVKIVLLTDPSSRRSPSRRPGFQCFFLYVLSFALMTHLGLICPELSGHLNPMTTLGRELRCRGHHVTVAIPVTNDQPGVASRLEWLGVAEVVAPSRLSAKRLEPAQRCARRGRS